MAVLALVLAVSGCGDDEGTDSGASADATGEAVGSTPVTPNGSASQAEAESGSVAKGEFVKKGNAICRATASEILTGLSAGSESGVGAEGRVAAAAKLVSTVMAPALRKEVERIEALGAPSGDEEQVEAILVATEGVIEEMKQDPEKFIRSNDSFAEPAGLADRYGLGECPYG